MSFAELVHKPFTKQSSLSSVSPKSKSREKAFEAYQYGEFSQVYFFSSIWHNQVCWMSWGIDEYVFFIHINKIKVWKSTWSLFIWKILTCPCLFPGIWLCWCHHLKNNYEWNHCTSTYYSCNNWLINGCQSLTGKKNCILHKVMLTTINTAKFFINQYFLAAFFVYKMQYGFLAFLLIRLVSETKPGTPFRTILFCPPYCATALWSD